MSPALCYLKIWGHKRVIRDKEDPLEKAKKRHNLLVQWFITLLSDNENNVDKNQLEKEPLDNTVTRVSKSLKL